MGIVGQIVTGSKLAWAAASKGAQSVGLVWVWFLPLLVIALVRYWGRSHLPYEAFSGLPFFRSLSVSQYSILERLGDVYSEFLFLALVIGAWRTLVGRQVNFAPTFKSSSLSVIWVWLLQLLIVVIPSTLFSFSFFRFIATDAMEPLQINTYVGIVQSVIITMVAPFFDTAVPCALHDKSQPIRQAVKNGYRYFVVFLVAGLLLGGALALVNTGWKYSTLRLPEMNPFFGFVRIIVSSCLSFVAAVCAAWLPVLLWDFARHSRHNSEDSNGKSSKTQG